MVNQCRHFIISGEVQGVFYRSNALKKARALQLTGWIKNRPDGKVEAMACGEEKAIDLFYQWLWDGPRAAIVQNIDTEILPWQNYYDFTIHYIS